MTAPTLLVLARAILTIPVCVLIAFATPETDLAALGLFALAAITDAIDGPIARARDEVTARGAMLDPLADKILAMGTLTALVLRGLAPGWALAVIVLREGLAIETRARAQRTLAATADAKLKTTLQLGSAAALIASAALGNALLRSAALLLLDAAVALTVVSGVRLMLRAGQTRADPR
jgi:CDP-diacylglycerol--glycerol-3-phosphate 3-phosphatidyltransferase